MDTIELFLAGVVGAAVGSFLGVVIDRGEISGRSRCSHCKHQLSWWENIPLLSFILLGGRCRKCRAAIPRWLPLIELAGVLSGVWFAFQASQTITVIDFITIIKFIGAVAIATALIWIFFSDLVKGLVPDWAVAIGALGAVLNQISQISPISLIWQIVAASVAAGFFWLLVIITRGKGMGTGDITLAFFLGLWLGWPKIAVVVWLAFLLGAAVALGLIASGRKKFGQTIPFGPFFITAAIISYFYGEKMLLWFL